MHHHYHNGQMSLLRLHASRQFISPTGRALYAIMHEKAVSDPGLYNWLNNDRLLTKSHRSTSV